MKIISITNTNEIIEVDTQDEQGTFFVPHFDKDNRYNLLSTHRQIVDNAIAEQYIRSTVREQMPDPLVFQYVVDDMIYTQVSYSLKTEGIDSDDTTPSISTLKSYLGQVFQLHNKTAIFDALYSMRQENLQFVDNISFIFDADKNLIQVYVAATLITKEVMVAYLSELVRVFVGPGLEALTSRATSLWELTTYDVQLYVALMDTPEIEGVEILPYVLVDTSNYGEEPPAETNSEEPLPPKAIIEGTEPIPPDNLPLEIVTEMVDDIDAKAASK